MIAGAVLFSAAYWGGYRLDFAFADSAIWNGQVWRLLTSCFIHGNILHLAFNLCGMYELGRPIEARYGSLRAGLIMVLLGAGSSAAQFLSGDGGIGLSGVLYGCLGLLWATRGNPRGTGYALTNRTIHACVVWFFFCLATTLASVWNVGNTAHASGLVLGFAMGRALVSERSRLWTSAMTAVAVLLMAATLYMPWSYRWWWHRGFEASERGDENRSLTYWVRAVDAAANDWDVEPLLMELGHEALYREDRDGAILYYRRVMAVSQSPGLSHAYLAYTYLVKGDIKEARELAKNLRDADLDPFLRDIPSFVDLVAQARAPEGQHASDVPASRPSSRTASHPSAKAR